MDLRRVLMMVGCAAVVGVVLVVLAAVEDRSQDSAGLPMDPPTSATDLPIPESDPALLDQMRQGITAAAGRSGAEFVVSGAWLDLLGNLHVDTVLDSTAAGAGTGLEVCWIGKSLGFADVEVRGLDGTPLASTGVFDNDCSRHL